MKQMGSATYMVETMHTKFQQGSVKSDDHLQDLGTDGIILKWTVIVWYLTSAIPTTECDIQNAECQVQLMGT